MIFDQIDENKRVHTSLRMNNLRWEEVKILQSKLDRGKDDVFNNAIYSYFRYRFCVVSIVNKISKKCYIDIVGLEKVLSKNFDIHSFSKMEPSLLVDYEQYGLGSFDIKIHAVFNSADEGLDYRDFLINRFIDSGYSYYSYDLINEIVPRFFILRIKYSISVKIIQYCVKKKITLNQLFLRFLSSLKAKQTSD